LRKKSAELCVKRIQHKEHDGWAVKGEAVEIPLDKRGRLSHTRGILTLPWNADPLENGRQPLLIGGPARTKLKETIIAFVNRFIDVVRYVTEQYHLDRVANADISSYDVFDFDGTHKTLACQVLDTGTGVTVKIGQLQFLPEEKKKQIEELLLTEGKLEPSKIFILNPKDAVLSDLPFQETPK
jgi:hypothetical protein